MIYFARQYTNSVKGIAIILMVALHLLQKYWMPESSHLLDLYVQAVPISSIVAYAGDICIGIFAFVTGYGWSTSFKNKSRTNRIVSLYLTYWLVLLVFDIPARIINNNLNSVSWRITLKEVLFSITALQSNSVLFQWYVFFFACAVLTFPLLWRFLNNCFKSNKGKYLFLIAFSVLSRIILSLVCWLFPIPQLVRDTFSHYLNWMPVLLIGALVCDNQLFERINEFIDSSMNNTKKIVLSYIVFFLILIGKGFFIQVSGITTNLDVIYIIPFMFCVITIARSLYNNMLGKALGFLGDLSLYIWLMHRVLLYEPLRSLSLQLQFPLIILFVAIVGLIPFALIIKMIDSKLIIIRGQL